MISRGELCGEFSLLLLTNLREKNGTRVAIYEIGVNPQQPS
jgi:hypothetical protein